MRQSFLALYDEYYPKLYAYILVRTRHRQQAEDIVQQTFVKALDKIDTFKPRRGATFGSWLFRIAKNHLIDEARGSHRVEFVSVEIETTSDHRTIVDELMLKDELAEEKETWNKVLVSIEQLSDAERELITLKYLADMSYKDIGALMNKKPNTLAVMLRRALEKIRNDIGYEN